MNITQFEGNFNFSNNELDVINFWSINQVYNKLIEKNKNGPLFRFMDGPPFVSSKNLHYGHVLVSLIKDTVLRWMRSHGFNVLNKNGKDCHGLPIEQVVNEILNVHTKEEVEDLGIDIYNKKCKELIKCFSESWKPIFERIGRDMNFSEEYKTCDISFMESVWWVFSQLWDKNLIYRGFQIMPFSTGCCTPLSNSEAGLNYKDITEMSIYVKFPLVYDNKISLVAWTTTPWTLPSNLALCVNPTLTYVKVQDKNTGNIYIVAKSTIKNIFEIPRNKELPNKELPNKELPYIILETFKGKELADLEYIPIFDYFAKERTFKVLIDDYVTPDNGTGIVHQAPAFGEEDFNICIREGVVNKENIGKFCPVNDSGCFTEEIYDLKGTYVKSADIVIIEKIKQKGRLVKKELYKHSYPFCYRTHTPLIYKATSSFFIAVSKFKDKIVENNKKVNWYPSYIGNSRFHEWLENAKDWGISRNRYFGTGIPVWVLYDPNTETYDYSEMICIKSIDHLVQLAGLKNTPNDIHREFIDNIAIPSKNGKGVLKRVPDVLDCWFESGCVPYGQIHYPFENKEIFDNANFLSDFICEGIDQTRGWFYTLMILSTALFNKPAFRNVICSGLVLGENNKKMSKSLGNFVDPCIALNENGADAVRLYLISSPASRAEPLKFDGEFIKNISGRLFQWFNGVKFFLEHLIKFNKDGNVLDLNAHLKRTNTMDKWIISRIGSVVSKIEELMADYRINKVMTEIFDFIEDLVNWYIKFNRSRIKGRNCSINEQNYVLSTLYYVLLSSSKTCAPFIPFLCETIYQKLKILLPVHIQELSVHHCLYPNKDEFIVDEIVERRMKRLQVVASLVRSMRSKTSNAQSVKVSLNCVTIAHNDPLYLEDIKELEEYLVEEINTVSINYRNQNGLVRYRAKPNHKTLGQKYRLLSKKIKDEIAKISSEVLADYKNGIIKYLRVDLNNNSYILEEEDVTIEVEFAVEWKETEMALTQGELIVIIDTSYNDLIKEQHIKRLFTSSVQQLRKRSIIRPWNKIKIYYDTNSKELINVLEKYNSEIVKQLSYGIYPKNKYTLDEPIIVQDNVDICGSKVSIILSDPTRELFIKQTE